MMIDKRLMMIDLMMILKSKMMMIFNLLSDSPFLTRHHTFVDACPDFFMCYRSGPGD